MNSALKILLPLALTLAGTMSASAATELVPVSAFFSGSEFSTFKLSPDGTKIAVLAPVEGCKNIYWVDLETGSVNLLTREKTDVYAFYWASNDRILFEVNWALCGVDLDGTDLEILWAAGSLLNVLPEDPDHVLVTGRNGPYTDVRQLNVITGHDKRVKKDHVRLDSYFASPNGDLLMGTGSSEDGWVRHYAPGDSEEWDLIAEFEFDHEAWVPVAILPDGDLLVASNEGRNTSALYRYDMQSRTRGSTPVLEDPVYDIDAAPIYLPGSTKLAGVSYMRDRLTQHYFDPEMQKLHDLLQEVLPERINAIVSASKSGHRLIIASYSDVIPVEYHLLDVRSMSMELLGIRSPALKQIQFQPTRPVQFVARDGLLIHGYLTLPAGDVSTKPVPMIALPHGGPWARNTWGLLGLNNLSRQFFVSRGFAVLEVDFRGSTGYGKEHLVRSFRQTEAMVNDVIDGVRWAVAEGFADPECLGIAGASWGGYTTLAALVKEPEMFKFGINLFGVCDLEKHIKRYTSYYWNRDFAYNYWVSRVGDPHSTEDRKRLHENSPINFIDRILAPVFIYHGHQDANAHIEQADKLIRALKKHDKKFTKIIRGDAAHSFGTPEERIEIFEAIDAFIAPFSPVHQKLNTAKEMGLN